MHVRMVGGDVSYPLTPTIRFVGTLNPDFSNVEIDQQTIAPQEFQRQLVEYRPFFAQGAAFINAASGPRTPAGTYVNPANLVFYSPSVGPFDSGAKVEGTFGDQSFGALTFHGYDETTNNTFSDQAYGYEHAVQGGSFIYWSDGVFANHSIAGTDTTIEGGVEARDLANGMIYFFDHAFENGSWVPQGHADFTEVVHRPPQGQTSRSMAVISTSRQLRSDRRFHPELRHPRDRSSTRTSSAIRRRSRTTANILRRGSLPGRFRRGASSGHAVLLQRNASRIAFSLNGMGEAVGQLRSYGVPAGPGCSGPILFTSSFTGYPCYLDGVTQPFNLYQIPVGYRDGSPTPFDASYAWGPFGDDYVHLFTIVTSRPLGRRISLGLEYDGTYERAFATGVLDSQWLRRVSLGYNVSSESSLSLELRDINGRGGFATQIGNNLAVAYHQRFPRGNELYVNFGSPAAGATLNRLDREVRLSRGGGRRDVAA